jgi:glycosyltransferase involved in cell wall biosynthesis
MPIVVSDNSGNAQVIENELNGLIVPIGNIDATQNALSRLTSDERLRDLLAKNARDLAMANYCEQEQLSRMTDLIKLAIGTYKNV